MPRSLSRREEFPATSDKVSPCAIAVHYSPPGEEGKDAPSCTSIEVSFLPRAGTHREEFPTATGEAPPRSVARLSPSQLMRTGVVPPPSGKEGLFGSEGSTPRRKEACPVLRLTDELPLPRQRTVASTSVSRVSRARPYAADNLPTLSGGAPPRPHPGSVTFLRSVASPHASVSDDRLPPQDCATIPTCASDPLSRSALPPPYGAISYAATEILLPLWHSVFVVSPPHGETKHLYSP